MKNCRTSAGYPATGMDFFSHWPRNIIRTLKVKGYLRYVDDMVFFARRRGELREWREMSRSWLKKNRNLNIHVSKIIHCPSQKSVFLGYEVSRDGVNTRAGAYKRLREKITSHLDDPGVLDYDALERSFAAHTGHLIF